MGLIGFRIEGTGTLEREGDLVSRLKIVCEPRCKKVEIVNGNNWGYQMACASLSGK